MKRHRGFILLSVLTTVGGIVLYFATERWTGWEEIYKMVSKGDNMPIAGLILSLIHI